MSKTVRLAAQLTPAQRAALLRHPAHPAFDWAVFNLIAMGLLTMRRRWFVVGPRVVRITLRGVLQDLGGTVTKNG